MEDDSFNWDDMDGDEDLGTIEVTEEQLEEVDAAAVDEGGEIIVAEDDDELIEAEASALVEDPYEDAAAQVEDPYQDIAAEAEVEAEEAPPVDDEAEKQRLAAQKEVELHMKLHGQFKEKEAKEKGKDKGKGKGKEGGKGKGKDKSREQGAEKGKGKSKDKGKDKGKAKGKDRGQYAGFVYQEIPATKTLLIKCWKANDEFGCEAVIPKWNNPNEAKVGDRISFDLEEMVQEGEGDPRPMACNVFIRERGADPHAGKNRPLTDVRTQVLFYLSDDNLKTDKFFQDIIAANEGGWIATTDILGCRRMKQLGASTKSIIECLRDATEVEVRDTPGKEAVRRKSPPPPLDEAAIAAKGQGKAKAPIAKAPIGKAPIGKAPIAKAPIAKAPADKAPIAKAPIGKSPIAKAPIAKAPIAKAPIAKAKAAAPEKQGETASDEENPDIMYLGVVANQQKQEPQKFFVTCEAITEKFSRDATFLPSQQPLGVEIGSIVAFTVPADSQKFRNPQANFVAAVAPLGEAVLAAAGESWETQPVKVGQKKRTVDGDFK